MRFAPAFLLAIVFSMPANAQPFSQAYTCSVDTKGNKWVPSELSFGILKNDPKNAHVSDPVLEKYYRDPVIAGKMLVNSPQRVGASWILLHAEGRPTYQKVTLQDLGKIKIVTDARYHAVVEKKSGKLKLDIKRRKKKDYKSYFGTCVVLKNTSRLNR